MQRKNDNKKQLIELRGTVQTLDEYLEILSSENIDDYETVGVNYNKGFIELQIKLTLIDGSIVKFTVI